jgi:hypothetical protein
VAINEPATRLFLDGPDPARVSEPTETIALEPRTGSPVIDHLLTVNTDVYIGQ